MRASFPGSELSYRAQFRAHSAFAKGVLLSAGTEGCKQAIPNHRADQDLFRAEDEYDVAEH